jgi:hypothetical protein
MDEITVPDDETNLTAKVTALDAEGHETTFDAAPTWRSSDDTVAVVVPGPDGYTATFEVGAPGTATITVTAASVPVEIVSTGQITVVAGPAVSASVDFNVPVLPVPEGTAP